MPELPHPGDGSVPATASLAGNPVHGQLETAPASEPQHSPTTAAPVEPSTHASAVSQVVPAPSGYELLDELDIGGMGVVYLARHAALDRPVALKYLRETLADDRRSAERFVYEARVTARLQHPGIPPVYEVGTLCDGRPFLAMKLIRGETLGRVLHRDGPHPTRWLAVFVSICQAVGYAHGEGFLHRDLKPGNVMVGAFGEVQVMDWGLAKGLICAPIEETAPAPYDAHTPHQGLTHVGGVVGTPAFMPPEQARGEAVDRRADVFGLGAILFALLTGAPPYVGSSTKEVRRKAEAGELADALERLDRCGADEELVAMAKRCLAVEPADRFADAREVADAVAAHLAGVQERLQQAKLAEAERRARAGEAAKRRRLAVALAATLLLAAASVGGTWLWYTVDRAARQASVVQEVREAMGLARSARDRAATADRAGAAALDAEAREQMRRAEALAEGGPASVELLAEVRQLREELDEHQRDRRVIEDVERAMLAQSELTEDRQYLDNGRAVPKLREAFEAYGMPAGQGDPQEAARRIRTRPTLVRDTLIAALGEWLDCSSHGINRPVAEPHREWLRMVLEQAEGDGDWARQVRAATSMPHAAERRMALRKLADAADDAALPVIALTRLARTLIVLGDTDGAVLLLRRVQGRHPGDYWANSHLGEALDGIDPPRHDEAARFMTAALALRPDSPVAQHNLGVMLGRKGDVAGAATCFKRAAAADPKYAAPHNNLGVLLQRKGDAAGAADFFRRAAAAAPNNAIAHYNLGNLLAAGGDAAGAAACFRRAVAANPKHAGANNNLGLLLAAGGDAAGAAACFRRAVAANPKYAEAHTSLGALLGRKGDSAGAAACYLRAVAADPKHAKAHHNLGSLLLAWGDDSGAAICFRRAVAADPKLADAHHNLGVLLGRKGDDAGAAACYLRAVAADPKHAKAHHNLGSLLLAWGDDSGAAICFRRAAAADPNFVEAHYNLGVLLGRKGDDAGAAACYRRAVASDPKHARAHCNLGVLLAARGDAVGATACYRRAIAADRNLAEAHNNLGFLLGQKGDAIAAATCYLRAVAADPNYATPHNNLGNLLLDWGDAGGAAACFRRAVAADPKHAAAHYNLGILLSGKGDEAGAAACLRRAVAADPKLALAHYKLGVLLERKGDEAGATACYRRAVAADPKLADAHHNLGVLLGRKGDDAGAAACYLRAVAADPKHAKAHHNLGVLLGRNGDDAGAAVCYRRAVAADPTIAESHWGLGVALRQQGRFAESLASFKRCHELGLKQSGWGYPSAEWVRDAKRLAALEDRLTEWLKGQTRPRDAAEGLALADVARAKKLHHTATTLFAEAFADPKSVNDRITAARYNAACLASLAASGQGQDAARLRAAQRAEMRRRSLTWLRADLALWSRLFAEGEVGRTRLAKTLAHWQSDADLAPLRDPAALKALSAEEREACQRLWADVAALLKKTQPDAK